MRSATTEADPLDAEAGERAASDADEPARRPEDRATSPVAAIAEDLRRLWRALRGLAEIEALQAVRALREGAWRCIEGLWASAALLCATAVAAALVLIGLAGALAELFGGRWWAGALGAGMLFFAGVPLVGAALKKLAARRRIRALRRPAARVRGPDEEPQEATP